MNTALVIGHIVRDADLRFTKTGKPVANFSIGWNKVIKGDKKSHFFDVVVWGDRAQNLAPHLLKGKKVGITGELSQRKREDHPDQIEIVAFSVDFLGGPRDED